MTLDQVISDIVYNKDVHNLLKQPDLTQPYGEIIQFQIDECADNDTSIDKEGFQIGEPFDGDVENAPILFLSSNPAFNFDEVSPRYFATSGKVFNPEHISATKRVKFSDSSKEYSFEEINKMFIEPQKEMSFDEIKDFFKTRIQTSPARNDKDKTLRISLKDGGTIGVPYWTCVRNNTELLLPTNLKNKWTNLNPSQRAREIMKYAVCMEIVPFRSSSEIGVNNELLDKCWIDFTKHLLELSGAEVFVLVGNKVFDVVARQLAISDGVKSTLKKHGVVNITIGNKQRSVEKVDFYMGKFVRFDNVRLFSGSVFNTLSKAVSTSPLVMSAMTAASLTSFVNSTSN